MSQRQWVGGEEGFDGQGVEDCRQVGASIGGERQGHDGQQLKSPNSAALAFASPALVCPCLASFLAPGQRRSALTACAEEWSALREAVAWPDEVEHAWVEEVTGCA